jgi:hypothetical protein
MSNKQAKQTTSIIDQDRARASAEHGQDRPYIQSQLGRVNEQDQALRNEILGGYRNLAGGKDVAGNVMGGLGGGYSAKLMGLDPSLANLEGRYQNLSGGLDRALPGYEEFAKTGGISDADRANIRSRGAETGSAIFGNLRNEMARRNQVQGGYSPGASASSARLAREQGIAAGKGARDTEMGISDAVRQGRLAGLGGMKEIGGMGYGGISDIANQRQNILAQNTQAENQAAAHNASVGRGNAEFAARAQLQGLGGLQEMYGMNPAETSQYNDMLLRERGLTDQTMSGNIQNRMGNVGRETSPWDRIMQGVGAGAGLASAFSPYNRRGGQVVE